MILKLVGKIEEKLVCQNVYVMFYAVLSFCCVLIANISEK